MTGFPMLSTTKLRLHAGLRVSVVVSALALTQCSQPDDQIELVYPLAESVLLPGEEWQLISADYLYTDAPAVDQNGLVYFSDVTGFQTLRENPDGSISVFDDSNGGSQGMMFGADGLLYTCSNREGKFIAYAPDGSKTDLYLRSGFCTTWYTSLQIYSDDDEDVCSDISQQGSDDSMAPETTLDPSRMAGEAPSSSREGTLAAGERKRDRSQ